MKNKIMRTVAVVLCFILTVLTFWGILEPVVQRCGVGALQTQNDQYLNRTFKKALAGFATMSAVKAGLAVIEGSTAGVSVGASFNLQVGDIVQSAYDYVDIAWRTLLTGCITILSIQYLLKAAAIVDGYVLSVTFFMLGISLLLRWRASGWTKVRETVRDILSLSIVASLAVLYILPISVWGASHLSRIITAPAIEEAQSGFAEAQTKLFPENSEDSDGIIAKVKQLPERFQLVVRYLKRKSTEMAVWSIKLIVGYIFDCIVFPITLFTLLLWLTRSIMRYIFHRNFQSSLRDDLKRIIIKQNDNGVAK